LSRLGWVETIEDFLRGESERGQSVRKRGAGWEEIENAVEEDV